jgi:hypothetical protein
MNAFLSDACANMCATTSPAMVSSHSFRHQVNLAYCRLLPDLNPDMCAHMPAQKMFALLFHKDSDINTGLSPGGTF